MSRLARFERISAVRELPADGRGHILVAVATGWFFSIGGRLAYPVLFGAAAERGFFDEGYVALAGLAVAAIALTALLPEE